MPATFSELPLGAVRATGWLAEQLALARQLVTAANARYASGTGSQPEVLRAEIEVSRMEAARVAL